MDQCLLCQNSSFKEFDDLIEMKGVHLKQRIRKQYLSLNVVSADPLVYKSYEKVNLV